MSGTFVPVLLLQLALGTLPLSPFLGELVTLSTVSGGAGIEIREGLTAFARGGSVSYSSPQLTIQEGRLVEVDLQFDFVVSYEPLTLYGGVGGLYTKLDYTKSIGEDIYHRSGEAYSPCLFLGTRLIFPTALGAFGILGEAKLFPQVPLAGTLENVGGWRFVVGLVYQWELKKPNRFLLDRMSTPSMERGRVNHSR